MFYTHKNEFICEVSEDYKIYQQGIMAIVICMIVVAINFEMIILYCWHFVEIVILTFYTIIIDIMWACLNGCQDSYMANIILLYF